MKTPRKRLPKWLTPARLIALGFLAVILLGSALLMLPCSLRDGVRLSYIDALYTSTSAVCVTGLATVDSGSTFSPIGQVFLALLIQIGGLGVATVSTGIMLALGRKIDLRSRNMIRESSGTFSAKEAIRLLQQIFMFTAIIELIGAGLSFAVFIRYYSPWKALGLSFFHSIASFNNSGFDVFGRGDSMIAFRGDIMLNLVTAALVILGGIGYLVMSELLQKRFRFRRLSMHARVVLSVSGALVVAGTLLLKLTEGSNITWLGALFASVSARTAGFATFPISAFSSASLMIVMVLMYIGASPGSTGGGIKTTTFFVMWKSITSSATNRSPVAFHYALPKDAFKKASMITLLAFAVVVAGTTALCVLEPLLPLRDVLFEVTSAFGTVGLSTGITSRLSLGSKLVCMLVMYIGRLGPMTIASLWHANRDERVRYPEGNIAIG